MSTEFEKVRDASAEKIASSINNLLLKFFGSLDDMKRYGHLYVLEETPMLIETCRQPEFTGDYFKVRTETKYRIRPKTQAELEAENRD